MWNQSRCPSSYEWINKMWHIYRKEYYAYIKKNEIVSLTGKWMEIEIITLSEIIQPEKDNHHMLSFICGEV
jgi:hypothetical protein